MPLQKGKNHIFGKWDFKITGEDTKMNLRVGFPTDKYLQDYIRLKIVSKARIHQDGPPVNLNACYFKDLHLPATEEGYILIVEGIMPYNTAEGQLCIDLNTNQENLDLHELVGCEPVEYSDAY